MLMGTESVEALLFLLMQKNIISSSFNIDNVPLAGGKNM